MIHRIKDKAKPALAAMEEEKGFYIWITCLFSMILLAGFSLLASLVTSLEIMEFSIKIPWAGMISTYVFLVAAGSGLCIINALGAVFSMHRYEMMGKRIAFLSLTLIVFGMLCIVLHLGHPERMPIYNAISPNFRSAISWMGALYSGYLLFVGLELYLLIRPDLFKKSLVSTGHMKTILTILTLEKFKDSYVAKVEIGKEIAAQHGTTYKEAIKFVERGGPGFVPYGDWAMAPQEAVRLAGWILF